MFRLLRRHAAADEVRIEVPPRDFEVALVRIRRVLFWSWTQRTTARLRVAALPLRELLVIHERLRLLAAEMDGLAPREALCVALGDRSVLRLERESASEIWDAWREANMLAVRGAGNDSPSRSGGSQTILDLALDLQRFPFNFSLERVLDMTAAEATAHLGRWAVVRAREAANA